MCAIDCSFGVQYLVLIILQRLDKIADAAPGLGESSRVMDVGTGTGVLIPHLQVPPHTDMSFLLTMQPWLASKASRQVKGST